MNNFTEQIEKPYLIAEIGCNHKGDMDLAKDMIKNAAEFCGVNAVKFQKRNPKELLTEKEYNNPHPNPINSYGSTYGEHREYLEFNKDQHKELQKWCNNYNVEYSSSVWDKASAHDIIELNPKMIKIPSACNLDFDILQILCEGYDGEIHVSLGMTTVNEEEKIISFFDGYNRSKDLVIYSCTSGYPVDFDDICLYEITRLYKKYENRVKRIGFSGHHLGIAADIAAMTLGASIIERHYTLDRTWKGTDHSASLEPDGMRKLSRDLKHVYKAMSYKATEILEVEQVQRKKLKRNC